MDAVNENLNKAIDGAEALFKMHGVNSVATYDTVPLEVDVDVMSSTGRRYLEVAGKARSAHAAAADPGDS